MVRSMLSLGWARAGGSSNLRLGDLNNRSDLTVVVSLVVDVDLKVVVEAILGVLGVEVSGFTDWRNSFSSASTSALLVVWTGEMVVWSVLS